MEISASLIINLAGGNGGEEGIREGKSYLTGQLYTARVMGDDGFTGVKLTMEGMMEP